MNCAAVACDVTGTVTDLVKEFDLSKKQAADVADTTTTGGFNAEDESVLSALTSCQNATQSTGEMPGKPVLTATGSAACNPGSEYSERTISKRDTCHANF